MMLYELFLVSYYYSNAYFFILYFYSAFKHHKFGIEWGDDIYKYPKEVILVYLPLYKAGMTYLIQNTAFNTRKWYFTRSMQFVSLKWS